MEFGLIFICASVACFLSTNQLVRHSCRQLPFLSSYFATCTLQASADDVDDKEDIIKRNSNRSLHVERLLRVCPQARTPLRKATSMICHGRLEIMDGINEIEVPVEI